MHASLHGRAGEFPSAEDVMGERNGLLKKVDLFGHAFVCMAEDEERE